MFLQDGSFLKLNSLFDKKIKWNIHLFNRSLHVRVCVLYVSCGIGLFAGHPLLIAAWSTKSLAKRRINRVEWLSRWLLNYLEEPSSCCGSYHTNTSVNIDLTRWRVWRPWLTLQRFTHYTCHCVQAT